MKKINVYLPGIHFKIMGGYKVVYQYCNYLAAKGYDVCIYYNEFGGKNGKHIPKKIALLLKKILSYNYPCWYKLNSKISTKVVPRYDDDLVRDADVSIATSFLTSYEVYKLSNVKGKKYYFIQGYEKWEGTTDEQLIESYNYGMNNIVISNWLKKIVDNKNLKKSKLIPNGIDLKKFNINKKIEDRNDFSISMLYHNDEIKGCKYGLEAIYKLKEKYKNLEVNLFGSPKRPKNLPKWIKYTRNATEDEVVSILNNSAIYICSSLVEGFGLPGLESMACGCALVTTDCIGIIEYANDNNAIIVPTKNSNKIFKSVSQLIEDKQLRIKIAKNGFSDSQKRNLINSCENFERYVINVDK